MSKFRVGDKVTVEGGFGLSSASLRSLGIESGVTVCTINKVEEARYHFYNIVPGAARVFCPAYEGIQEEGLTLVEHAVPTEEELAKLKAATAKLEEQIKGF